MFTRTMLPIIALSFTVACGQSLPVAPDTVGAPRVSDMGIPVSTGTRQTIVPRTSLPEVTLTAPPLLDVASFSVLEVQYPGATSFEYAPLIDVVEKTGANRVTVTAIALTLPGVRPWLATSYGCVLGPGQRASLFPYTFDFAMTFQPMGPRLSGESTVVLRFADEQGRVGEVSATTMISPGQFPGPTSASTVPCGLEDLR